MQVNAIWIGDSIPLLQRICLSSWQRHGHECHLWLYDQSLNVPDGVIKRDASEVLGGPIHRYQDANHRGSPVLHANIWRYEFLAQRGGCTVEADTLCLKWFDLEDRWAFSSEGKRHPNLAFVNIPMQDSSFARQCVADCYSLLEEQEHMGPSWGKFGPKLLRRNVELFGMEDRVLDPHVFCPINWNHANDIFREDAPNISRSFGIHLWQAVFDKNGIDLNAEHPSTSLWEGWKREYHSTRI